eukprot:GHRR01000604.1.p1 GENE.GHRR01000604.1~~GHRR01000604.1.p1  ORF type:complete len:204 (+),score=45.69 GHRR01000604.1:192-803(+)
MDGTTLGVAPTMPILPAGGGVDDIKGVAAHPAVTKPFADTAPEIQDLINTMLGIYTARGHGQLTKVYERFKFNCVFDLPLAFVRGADRMRALSNLIALYFDKVVAEPRLVSVQMLNNKLGRIDLEGTLYYYPRGRWLPLANLIIPEKIALHNTWTIVATGEDDKVLSVTETMHNLVKPPRILRAIWATMISNVALMIPGKGSW